MNPQGSLTCFFSLTEDIIETNVPPESNENTSSKVRKRKRCGLNYKSLFQFLLLILSLVFQAIILVVDYRKSNLFSNEFSLGNIKIFLRLIPIKRIIPLSRLPT
jgi:hypothetical protein